MIENQETKLTRAFGTSASTRCSASLDRPSPRRHRARSAQVSVPFMVEFPVFNQVRVFKPGFIRQNWLKIQSFKIFCNLENEIYFSLGGGGTGQFVGFGLLFDSSITLVVSASSPSASQTAAMSAELA